MEKSQFFDFQRKLSFFKNDIIYDVTQEWIIQNEPTTLF